MPLELGPLRERNFRLLAGARTISFLGTNLAPIAVAFAVLDLTGSATDVGIAFACWTLAQISTLLIGGVVADRLPRRLVMLSSDSANFAIRAAMGALLVSGHARIWEIFVLSGARRRSDRVLLAGLDRSRPRDGSTGASPTGQCLHEHFPLPGLPGRRGSRRHDGRDDW